VTTGAASIGAVVESMPSGLSLGQANE